MAAARWVYTAINRTMVSSAGGEFDRRRGRGGTCGEDVCASFWAAIGAWKKMRESDGRRGLGFRWLLLDGGTQQPTKSRPKLWDIFLGDGAQGDDDRGGCCRIVWAIELLDKNK
jgi:hypothetical protein